MLRYARIFAVLAGVLLCPRLGAQDGRYDVFTPIGKYMVKGDADCLSAWFDDNLEIAIISDARTASRVQARQIMKVFFENYTPRSFNITQTAEQSNMKYALGSLSAGGETFAVSIFVSSRGDSYKIQSLKIEQL